MRFFEFDPYIVFLKIVLSMPSGSLAFMDFNSSRTHSRSAILKSGVFKVLGSEVFFLWEQLFCAEDEMDAFAFLTFLIQILVMLLTLLVLTQAFHCNLFWQMEGMVFFLGMENSLVIHFRQWM